MTLRSVAKTFTLDQTRLEFNSLAGDVNDLSLAFDEKVDDRVSSLLVGGTGISSTYNDLGNSLTLSIDFTEFSTSNITEGTNLYYTDERVDDRVSSLVVGGTGISSTYNDLGNSLTLSIDFTEFSTTNITEGTNLYYTDEKVDDRIDLLITAGTGIQKTYNDSLNTYTLALDFTEFSTTNVSEGTNYYYTTTRANTDIDARVTASFVELLGIRVGKLSATAAPATASSTGTAGEIRYDSSYIYICTAANTWKRVAIATWP